MSEVTLNPLECALNEAQALRGQVDALQAENAKLRELCEQCAIELYVNGNVTDASTEMLFDDMRELGIEVGRVSKYVGFRLGKVHESHVISEYYCGGCGWPVTDHDSFCPECGGAFRECDASNLEAENAKLRELVRQMHPRAKAFLQLGVQLGCNDTLSYDWELQMRELGVEVSDGN